MNIIICGGPGAGKETQGVNISKELDLERIVTGDILRAEANSESPLGIDIKVYIDNGNLVPDSLLNMTIAKHVSKLKKAQKGIIFDGFPRRRSQAEFLDTICNIDIVIGLEVSDENLKTRLLKRAETSTRIDDKDINVINHRINVYHTETTPIIDHYKSKNKYVAIDGNQSIDDIYSDILKVVSNL
jgi:adenylate kinase